jgi:hypothetical protein
MYRRGSLLEKLGSTKTRPCSPRPRTHKSIHHKKQQKQIANGNNKSNKRPRREEEERCREEEEVPKTSVLDVLLDLPQLPRPRPSPSLSFSCGAGEAASCGRAGLGAVGFDVRPVGSTADLLPVLVDGRADQAAHRTVHQFRRIPPL